MQFGVVHQRRSEAYALPHAARVAAHRPILRVLESDHLYRAVGGVADVGYAMQFRRRFHQLPAGQKRVYRLAFRHEADAPVYLRVVADRLAERGYAAARRRAESDDHIEQRRLARAVRTKKARYAGMHVQRHFVDRDYVAEPLGYVGDFYGWRGVHVASLLYRHQRMNAGMATTTAHHATANGAGRRLSPSSY